MQKMINYRISIHYSTLFMAFIFALLSLYLTSQMVESYIGSAAVMVSISMYLISWLYVVWSIL
ncbi:hypothetical protein [Aliarcobacter cryaerophilus]|uniref:hypothetical protein n=1 Tax=Aliarcobacter cryaerophilus TaxID=28198 RepID=UPI0021B41C6F|nr:hypothetical protein [Aliarcobacter cryaerophilus]MCT7527161.1 hypothetical protein [Aliarcobacter cryaerophilus]